MAGRRLAVVVGLAAVALAAACGAGPAFDARPTATVEELMRVMVDPAADAVWDAVVTDATADGIVEIRPETEADWRRLRVHALTLAEAPTLLMVPGRRIAGPESRSELPGIDLHPDAIEALVAEDWVSWVARAGELRETAVTVLEAIEARDLDALLTAGTELDAACEGCHAQYWYPGHADPRPAP